MSAVLNPIGQPIGNVFHDLTEAEREVGLTYEDIVGGYLPGDIRRYGTNTTPGVTDMTAAINTAITVASTAGGGRVYLPPGVYAISDSGLGVNTGVDLKEGVWLQGAGVGVTILRGKPSSGDLNLVGNSTRGIENVSISDMTLDHNALNLGASSGCHGIRLDEVSNVRICRVAVLNTDHHGITTTTNSQDLELVNSDYFLSDIYLENIGASGREGGDGIRIFNGAGRLVINNVIGFGIELHGIHCGSGQGAISNILIRECGGLGLSVQSEGVLATNIHIENQLTVSDLAANLPAAGTMGRWFYATDSGDWYRDNGAAWHTYTNDHSLNGIRISTRSGGWPTAERVQITNIKVVCEVTQNQPYDSDDGDGLWISAPQAKITNATVKGDFRYGINVASVDKTQIIGATIEGVRRDGVLVGASANDTELHAVHVISASQESTGTYPGIRLSGSDTRIFGGSSVSADVSAGILEDGSANRNKIFGMEADTVTLIGADSGRVSFEDGDLSAATISASSNVTVGGSLTVGDGDLAAGDTLLRLRSDRAWKFLQSGADGTADLALQTEVDAKAFVILTEDGNDEALRVDAVNGDSVVVPYRIQMPASTTTRATFRINHGTAPTSPVDGDIWTTTAGLFVRINGSTVGPLS